ncbi:CDP-alcohol phosphatidyltransferase family protein [Halobacteriales archaeon QS_3_64_16]|nr:MAG: CDP-alcohol phosphatidyltransferase family protein [Halobacteriales archaeon QS_3_64_16]
MTLDEFRPAADELLKPFVSLSVRLGLTPNGVSLLAFLLAAAAAGTYYLAANAATWYLLGAVLVLANGWLDLLDGALARRLEVDSEGGDLLDHVLDRYADILIIAGLAAGLGRYGLGLAAVTGVLMTSYLGTQSQAVGLDRVYGGLLGRADRLALVGLVTAVAPAIGGQVVGLTLVGWLLVVFAIVGHLTALQRFYGALGALS